VKVRIIGDGALATLFAGMLAAEKQEVTLSGDPETIRRLRGKEIRIITPQGWRRAGGVRLSSATSVRPDELGIVALSRHRLKDWSRQPRDTRKSLGSSKSTLLLLDCDDEQRAAIAPEGSTVLEGLTLLDVFSLEPTEVELCSPRSWFVFEKNALLRELRLFLKAWDFDVLEVEDVAPFANALSVWKLLELPVAMCHCTLNYFLSYPEGRDIARRVLEEGLQTLARLGRPLKKLPAMDPQDLIQKLEKKEKEFERFRFVPDRAYNPSLQSMLCSGMRAAKQNVDGFVRMASRAGVDPKTNWSLGRKLSRVQQVGFYRGPAELYGAIT